MSKEARAFKNVIVRNKETGFYLNKIYYSHIKWTKYNPKIYRTINYFISDLNSSLKYMKKNNDSRYQNFIDEIMKAEVVELVEGPTIPSLFFLNKII